MTARSIPILALILLFGACDRAGRKGDDVLSTTAGTRVVYATTNCTVPHPDGVQCNEKTCKADEKSDCTAFAKGCVEYGNFYKGSNDAGTCTRVL